MVGKKIKRPARSLTLYPAGHLVLVANLYTTRRFKINPKTSLDQMIQTSQNKIAFDGERYRNYGSDSWEGITENGPHRIRRDIDFH